MDRKNILIICLVALVIIIGSYSLYYYSKNYLHKNSIILILDYGNNQKQSFRLEKGEKNSAWNFLQQVAAIKNIDLVPAENFYPQKIDGKPNGEDNKQWNFYVNGQKQEKSPLETIVEPPAKIVFKFE